MVSLHKLAPTSPTPRIYEDYTPNDESTADAAPESQSNKISSEIDNRAAQRLRAGDFVRPVNAPEISADYRAVDLARHVIAERNFVRETRQPPRDNNPVYQYDFQVHKATRETIRQEQQVAWLEWSSLPINQRYKVLTEIAQTCLTQTDPFAARANTPELDKFIKMLAQKLRRLEHQRKEAMRQVWQGLKPDEQFALLQRDEYLRDQRKYF